MPNYKLIDELESIRQEMQSRSNQLLTALDRLRRIDNQFKTYHENSAALIESAVKDEIERIETWLERLY